MSRSHTPEDTSAQPSPTTLLVSKEVKRNARELKERAQDLRARTHQVTDETRQLFKRADEIAQHNRARQEYRAEQADRFPQFPPPLSSPTLSPPALPHVLVHILLIEDSLSDITLFQEALKEVTIPCQLTVLSRSSEVEAFVSQAKSVAPAAYPLVIILDYFLDGLDPAEALALLRSLPGYERIPVILFSGLPEIEGQRQYALMGTTAFVQKPTQLQPYFDAVAGIVYRWGTRSDSIDPTSDRGERHGHENDEPKTRVD
jgi:chemotaxis family two-component system response regulator Rcp1